METHRLTLPLLSVALLTGMFAGTQQSTTSASALAACCYGPSEPLQKYILIPEAPIPDPRDFFKGSRPRDKSLLWKTHLALQLVHHPEFEKQQVQVVLDAIDLSTTEFFTVANTTSANRTKADEDLEALTRRAISVFSKDQVVQLFANAADTQGEQDLLRLYYDLSALSLSKRRSAFGNATANVKSSLWKTHLALFFVKRELTQWQKEVIWSAMSLATRSFYESRSTDPDWETTVRQPTYWLEQQIFNAFSRDEAARIFATLGDDGESAKSSALVLLKNLNYKPLSKSGPYKQLAHTPIDRQDMEIAQTSCSCSMESDYCPIWSGCNNSNCTPTQGGCGTMWGYPCTGACR